jgi:hypothetical protein
MKTLLPIRIKFIRSLNRQLTLRDRQPELKRNDPDFPKYAKSG